LLEHLYQLFKLDPQSQQDRGQKNIRIIDNNNI